MSDLNLPWMSLAELEGHFDKKSDIFHLVSEGHIRLRGRFTADFTDDRYANIVAQFSPIPLSYITNATIDYSAGTVAANRDYVMSSEIQNLSIYEEVQASAEDVSRVFSGPLVRRTVGRPNIHNWHAIEALVRTHAPKWTGSQNKFFEHIKEILRASGLKNVPDTSTLTRNVGLLYQELRRV